MVIVHFTHWYVVDGIAALAVSLLLIRMTWVLVMESIAPLMDAKLPAKEEGLIREVLLAERHIMGYHKLRTRQAGHQRHVDVHIQLPDALTLVQAHAICEGLEEKARAALPNLEITIHYEPYEAEKEHQALHHTGS